MDEKILVYVEEKKKTEFYESVDYCCDRVNSLVQIFEAFQEWRKITTEAQFADLCRNPRQYFDNVLTENIHLSAGKAFNVEVAAQLFDIRRDEYLNMVDGLPIIDDACIPCKKVKVKKGQRAIFITEYDHYKEFLTFVNGRFSVNEAAVEDYVKTFDIYAEGIDQVDTYTHFKDLVAILNLHEKKFGLNSSDKQMIAKALHLYLVNAISGEFMTNAEFIKDEIQKLKYYENRTLKKAIS